MQGTLARVVETAAWLPQSQQHCDVMQAVQLAHRAARQPSLAWGRRSQAADARGSCVVGPVKRQAPRVVRRARGLQT
jgi:hypothetical protein